MDPFEVRMQFLTLLRRLNASQQSIQKIVGYAMKYFSRCGDDLWECVFEECQKGSLNMRINILYLLDNLCEASLMHQSQTVGTGTSPQGQATSYVEYVSRDLMRIVELVVPDNRDGLVNLMSTRQILDSWRSKRLLDPTVVDDVVQTLDRRKESLHLNPPLADKSELQASSISKEDVLKRFEEDRERHKLLRQKRWHVPVPPKAQNSQQMSTLLPRLSSSLSIFPSQSSSSTTEPPVPESALDIEFENAWETTSDWNEDDDEACNEENVLCFGRDPLSGQRVDPFGTAPASHPASAYSSYSHSQGVDNKPPTQSAATPPTNDAGNTSIASGPSFAYTRAPPYHSRTHSNSSPGSNQNNGTSFGYSANSTSYNSSSSSPNYLRAYAQSSYGNPGRTSSYNASYRASMQNGDASYQRHSQAFGTGSHSWQSGRGY